MTYNEAMVLPTQAEVMKDPKVGDRFIMGDLTFERQIGTMVDDDINKFFFMEIFAIGPGVYQTGDPMIDIKLVMRELEP
jgi:hypothetical protein